MFTDNEKDFFRMLWRVGVCDLYDAKKEFKISFLRMQELVKMGYVEIDGRIIRFNLEKNVADFYCRDILKLRFKYRSSRQHIEHDMKLSKAYLQLPKKIRETWVTESEIHDKVKDDQRYQDLVDKIKKGRNPKYIPDAAIYSEKHNGFVGFECLTKSYSAEAIQQKRDFADTFLCGLYLFGREGVQ